jgi:hypothetical protein
MSKTAASKPVFVVVNRKGQYFNRRTGGFDPVFDPFRHLFPDAKIAPWYTEGPPDRFVREVKLTAEIIPADVPVPTPKTKKEVTK